LRKDCLDFADYYDNGATVIQLNNDNICFVMLLRTKGNAGTSNAEHALEY